MNPPVCRLCRHAHWSNAPCTLGRLPVDAVDAVGVYIDAYVDAILGAAVDARVDVVDEASTETDGERLRRLKRDRMRRYRAKLRQ